ncbi:MAG TPA: GDSL-type esterase/lipase family protein [Acidimicrobiia bacterium]|nr:GDSL-type esterase/lipase family protein [Acidimicrobiia bacterium]
MSVVIFGDSITNRASDETGGGWTSRLWSLIFHDFHTVYAPGVKDSNHSVLELGIGGDTIVGVSKRFESELRTRIEIAEHGIVSDVVVGLAVGVNDSRVNGITQLPEVPLDLFEETYSAVLARLKEIGVDVFTVGLTPCDDSKMSPCLFSQDNDDYTIERIKRYDAAVQKCAAIAGVSFVEVFPAFNKIIADEGLDALLADGLHPNDRGHELIAELVFAEIRSKL